ncbi:hypothetical protein IW262DRAFT_1559696 [Armillaria fumosa]|nr:hypothetical protein IW262DRAFT_1559696 [Armillaria fumosa]
MSLPSAPKDISAHPQKGSVVDPANKAANVDRKETACPYKLPPDRRPPPSALYLPHSHTINPSTSSLPSTHVSPSSPRTSLLLTSLPTTHASIHRRPSEHYPVHSAVLPPNTPLSMLPSVSARTTPRVASARALLHLARAYCLCEMVSAKRAF